MNTVDLRKGCLTFWKPGDPNLTSGLAQLPESSQKLLLNKILALIATWTSGVLGKRGTSFEQGKITPSAQFCLTSR